MPFLTFCQTKFREVVINQDTLGCIDAAGAAQLANYIADLEQAQKMLPVLDTALSTCTALVDTKTAKIDLLEQQGQEAKNVFDNQVSIMHNYQEQIANDTDTILLLQKENKKMRRKNKTSLIIGGVVAGILSGVIIAVAL